MRLLCNDTFVLVFDKQQQTIKNRTKLNQLFRAWSSQGTSLPQKFQFVELANSTILILFGRLYEMYYVSEINAVLLTGSVKQIVFGQLHKCLPISHSKVIRSLNEFITSVVRMSGVRSRPPWFQPTPATELMVSSGRYLGKMVVLSRCGWGIGQHHILASLFIEVYLSHSLCLSVSVCLSLLLPPLA